MPTSSAPARLRIDLDQASDPGRDPAKQVNEDSCGYAETRLGYLAVLCDGMGGHYGGKEASRLAIATVFELFERVLPTTSPSVALKGAIEEAGRRVYALGGPPENRVRPGSTIVAMLLHDRGVDVAHVGDSRAYCLRAGRIYPLTRDHSVVQGMVDAGQLTEEQAIGHPDANKITRALGMKPDCEVEVRPESMELFTGDVLLACSDGLTDLVLPHEILRTAESALGSSGVSGACKALVTLANERGGHDNITVQMARVVEARPAATLLPEALGAAPTRVDTSPPTSMGAPGPALHGLAPRSSVSPTIVGTPPPPEARVGASAVSPTAIDALPAHAAGPSRGGLVAVIIGLSAVIAVLLVAVLWALFFR